MTEKTTVSIRPKMEKYQTSRASSGSASKICGDEVSQGMAGVTLEEAYSLAAAVTGNSVDALTSKYKERNVGQQRMILGNLIRGVVNAKDEEKASKAKATFSKQAAAMQKLVEKRQKDKKAAADKAKADRDKERAEKKKTMEKEKAERAKERAEKAKGKEAPKAKATKPKKATAPKEPRKPAAKAKKAA